MPHAPVDDLPLSSSGWARQQAEDAWIQAVNAKDWAAVDARIARGEDPHDLAGRLFLMPHWLDDPQGGDAGRLLGWQAAGVDLLRFRLVEDPLGLDHGSLDVPDRSVRPLQYALERAHSSDAEMAGILGVLLNAGARWRNEEEESELLRLVVVQHRPQTLDVLVEQGLNPRLHVEDDAVRQEEYSPDHRSALHLAAAYGNEALVRRLTALGLDLHTIDPNGNTPLHAALFHPSGRTEGILGALLDAGADPDQKTDKLPPKDLVNSMKDRKGRGQALWETWTRAVMAHEQRVLRAQINESGSAMDLTQRSPRQRL